MIAIDRILCPVDFSDVSRRALEHAAALGRRQQARVVAVNVAPAVATVPTAPAPVPGAVFPPTAEERRTRAAELEELVSSVRAPGEEVEARSVEGDVVSGVLGEARDLGADLIVMGTHGKGGFERLVLGSATEKIVRKAPCPVLTVSPPAADEAPVPPRYERVLCAVDFSDASPRALEYALLLAEDAESDVALVHVVEEPVYAFLPPERDLGNEGYWNELLQRAEERLRGLVPENASDLCSPSVHVRKGRVHQEILSVARERDSQVIVMGVHGRGVLERLFLGSVTNHVLREASCPVFTVREVARPAREEPSRRDAATTEKTVAG
jgi:nucleotide-binding universal stress UspA family protein